MALACSAPEARVRPTLDALGLSDRLTGIVTAEDVARGRPDPEAILYAAQQLGRPPIRCVLIGVSLRLPQPRAASGGLPAFEHTAVATATLPCQHRFGVFRDRGYI